MANLDEALLSVDATLADVFATRIYLLDARARREVGRAFGEVFSDVRLTATLVEVRALPGPCMLVEIAAEARVR
ncbi:Rid family hydrolase [Phenylobacterium sp.]|uniref:Rid family hydrolase n=1 Tax=Phenylobacterium sp. TaxID=1871053 RepID=UPI0030F49C4E